MFFTLLLFKLATPDLLMNPKVGTSISLKLYRKFLLCSRGLWVVSGSAKVN